jgi:predicted O-linked N-acetylglucosamine transferase (SPINDLY family)
VLLQLLEVVAARPAGDAEIAAAIRFTHAWPLQLIVAVGIALCARSPEYPLSLEAVADAAEIAATHALHVDELRCFAAAAANAGLHVIANRAFNRYIARCDALYGVMMPLGLPRRTAGQALRIGVVVEDRHDPRVDDLIVRLRTRLTRGVQCTRFVQGADRDPLESHDAEKHVLPTDPDIAARAIASLDVDVLIDAAGVRMPTGPIFARRPARQLWGVQVDGVGTTVPLWARVFDDFDARRLADALVDLDDAVQRDDSIDLDAVQFDRRWNSAVQAHQAGKNEEAIAGYDEILRLEPDYVPALYLRSVLERSVGDIAGARDRLHAALAVSPRFVEARAALADVEVTLGNAEAAASVARKGLESDGDSPLLWRALGHAALAEQDAGGAITAFSRAVDLEPTHAETHYNHGVALQMARRTSEAARAYQRALALQPGFVSAEFNLGVVFDQQGQGDAAIAVYSNVLKRAPAHARAYKALSEALLAAGRIDAWFDNFGRFEAHCPRHPLLASTALEVCAYRADFGRLEDYLLAIRRGEYLQGEAEDVLDALQQLLYLVHFFDVEPSLVGQLARQHDALARRVYGDAWPSRASRRPGPIRIGYLSGDFRNHVMGKMMYEALSHHDRERFDIFGYSTSGARDAWTERYETLFNKLEPVTAMSDDEAASRIAEDDLDVLVDLSTHTKGARPGILARKPARVQITHVATAGTLGMSVIDYKLTDRYADLAIDPEVQIERRLVMDGCVYPYRHIPSAALSYRRDALALGEDKIVIGAFVTPLKLSQRCLMLWRQILQRIPNAVVAFSPVHPSLRAVFQRMCHEVAIDQGRIVFIPQGRDDAENQARYALIDFVLDPMPYGGVNGTLEALDSGVPVVTLVGKRHAERTSYSILRNLGVTDTIANTAIEYVEIASRLASDGEFMRNVRSRISDGLRASPLTDMRAHTRNLERAYLSALQERAQEVLHDARASVQPTG